MFFCLKFVLIINICYHLAEERKVEYIQKELSNPHNSPEVCKEILEIASSYWLEVQHIL